MRATLSRKVALEGNESILKQSRANLQTDFIIPSGGRLFLTNKRLIFLPDRLSISPEKLAGITINLSDIETVGKKKGDMTNLLAGSFRSRLDLCGKDESYIFQVWGLDEWIKRIKEAMPIYGEAGGG